MKPGDDTSKLDPKDLQKEMLSRLSPGVVIPSQLDGTGDRAIVVSVTVTAGRCSVVFDRDWSYHRAGSVWKTPDFKVVYWTGGPPPATMHPSIKRESPCGKFVVLECIPDLDGINRFPNRRDPNEAYDDYIGQALAGDKPWLNECSEGSRGYHALYRRADVPWLRTTTATVVAPKPMDSPWNGRCPRCGRGTYIGLFKSEHEGGACRP